METVLKRLIAILILLCIAFVSFTFLAERFSSVDTYKSTIDSLDDKAETVLKLSAAATVAGAAISAIPDDTATPIADKLVDFTGYFLIILTILFAEKYIITILGLAAFKIMIPLACLIGISTLFTGSTKMFKLALKIVLVSILLCAIIPGSIFISNKFDETYQESFDQAVSEADILSQEVKNADDNETTLSSVLSSIPKTIASLINKGGNIITRFIEALAIMIVTTCVIPIAVLLLFLWLIKQILGIDINISIPHLSKIKKKNNLPQIEE